MAKQNLAATIRCERAYCPACGSLETERTGTKARKFDAEGIVIHQQRRCLACGWKGSLFINLVAAPGVPLRDSTLGRRE
jgi:C4-type Zn-finger protein